MMFLIENHRKHQSVRFFMANHCQKHSPLPRPVYQALLCPSIDPRLRMDHPPMRNPYFGIGQFVWQGLGLLHYRWVWMYWCCMIIWNNWRSCMCLYLAYWLVALLALLTIVVNLYSKTLKTPQNLPCIFKCIFQNNFKINAPLVS